MQKKCENDPLKKMPCLICLIFEMCGSVTDDSWDRLSTHGLKPLATVMIFYDKNFLHFLAVTVSVHLFASLYFI